MVKAYTDMLFDLQECVGCEVNGVFVCLFVLDGFVDHDVIIVIVVNNVQFRCYCC